MEPRRRIKLGKRPVRLAGHIISLVEIHRGEVTLDIEEADDRLPDIDSGGKKLDTKSTEK